MTEQHVTREEYERVVHALCPEEEADEVMDCCDSGWCGFDLLGPISVGLAAVSRAHAEELQKLRPDFSEQIAELQRDPEAALADLKRQVDSL